MICKELPYLEAIRDGVKFMSDVTNMTVLDMYVILFKYMNHVAHCEGIDFCPSKYDMEFNATELAILEGISKAIRAK